MDSIVDIEVDDSLLLPDMFSIRLRDPSFNWADSNNLDLGKKVEISARSESGTGKLLEGEITALEPEFSQVGGPVLVVRGYDPSHRLHRARQTKTYVQETDSDIARKIARACGFRADVDSTREVHEYVCQDNQTDMEFLQERAERIGYRMYVEDDKLYFKEAPQSEPDVPELEWGQNLLEFQARLTTAQQVSEVSVRGWDPKNKQEIIGQATSPQDTPQVGETRSGGAAAQRAFSIQSQEIVTDRPVATQAEADALAQAICDEIGNSFIQAEGICRGNPGVHAGTIVELKGVGQRFSGRYRITHALHRYDPDGYTTRFTVSGRRANTLSMLLAQKTRNAKNSNLVIGIVTNNQDPEEWGRVKVKFPTLPGNEESHWARLVSPMAGAERGFEFIPEVNDEVVVAFEHGDFNRPFVIGSLWNGQDKPPEAPSGIVNSSGKVDKRLIRSRTGHTITLDDTDGSGKVIIVDQTGKNLIEIDSAQNTISIKADDKAEIETKSGHKVTLDDTGGKIEIVDKNGSNAVKIDSNQSAVSIESAMNLTLKAQMIKIEAQSQLDLKSTGMMNVQSTNTTVKGDAMLTLQGGLVKIN
jgi:phage protein D